MSAINETTRCHPRTLREAFPFESDVIEHFPGHGQKLADKAVNWALFVSVIALILVLSFGAQP